VTAMYKSAPRLSVLFFPLCLLLFSCGTQQTTQLTLPAGRQGLVHGGQQPVTGATIQLYAVGTTGDGSPSTPLLSPAVVTDANGAFNLAGKFSCPSPSSPVYILAIGGNPGLPQGTNNPALAMMAALGPCGNLSATTFIFIDELTTVAAVYSLAPYISSPSAIGSSPGDAPSLANAFTLASQLVNTTTGTAPGTGLPAGTTVPASQINTIGDILSTCVNTAGGISGDNTLCGTLFSLTTPTGVTPPTDTITALLHLANDPTLNTLSLYSLLTPTAPFQPTQPQAPPDLTVRLTVPSGFIMSSPALNFPATRTGYTSAPQAVTFTNNTAAPIGIDIAGLTYFNPSLSGTNPGDFALVVNSATPENCPTPVMPGATCTLQLTFTPTAIGPRSAYIVINNSSANPILWVLLTGNGLEASAGPAMLSPSSLAFTASATPMNATLSNLSPSLPLTIDGITISNDPTSGQPAFTQTNNCGTSLAPQATCTIAVSAVATTQPYSTGKLTIVDDAAPSANQTLLLSYSNGFTGQILFDFGSRSVGTQGTGGFNFIPPGLPAGLNGLDITGPNATDFSFGSSQSGSCTTSRISPFCGGVLYFTPSALGLRTATLNVNGVPYGGLIGIGLPGGLHFSVAPGSFDFSSVAIGQTSVGPTLTIVNTGTVPIVFNAPVLNGPNPTDFSYVSNCVALAPNGTCSVPISASPTQPANRFATLTFAEGTSTEQHSVSLRVLGLNPSPVATPNSLNFPYTPFGATSAAQSFNVTSFNNDPVTIQVVDSAFLPFIITQGSYCSTTPCQVSVVFAPTATNTAPAAGNNSYGDILVTDLFSGQATLVSLSGIWQPPPP